MINKPFVAEKIEDRVDELEERVESQLVIAEKIGLREDAMRRVCGTIALIALFIEIGFFLAAGYGVIGGLGMKFGWVHHLPGFNVFVQGPSDRLQRIIMPMERFESESFRIPDFPQKPFENRVFLFPALIFFLAFECGFVIDMIRRIFSGINRGSQPFCRENIKYLIITSALVFLMCFQQPMFILLELLLIALILIFQYGNVLQQKADSTINDQENIIFSLAEITEAKSGQTGQHIKRVSEYSRVLAAGMGLSAARTEEIRLASVLHDVGKLMIDSRILDKPGKLTDEEYAIIKQHVDYGEKLLDNVDGSVLSTAKVIARDHHERWDGKGYSRGRSENDVSLEGRIVAVADVFDALSSKRSYKDAWSLEDAYNEIIRNAGTQFDPSVVEVFKSHWSEIQSIAEQYK